MYIILIIMASLLFFNLDYYVTLLVVAIIFMNLKILLLKNWYLYLYTNIKQYLSVYLKYLYHYISTMIYKFTAFFFSLLSEASPASWPAAIPALQYKYHQFLAFFYSGNILF